MNRLRTEARHFGGHGRQFPGANIGVYSYGQEMELLIKGGKYDGGLLLQNEYLIAENRILRSHLRRRVPLTNAQRTTRAEIAKRMGRRALEQVASIAKPETILAWYRKVIARKFDGSKHRGYPGRSAVCREVIELIVRMARENSGWGYDRIARAR
ncbi:MAG TPA: hypothetical protein VH601_18340 [Bryobacteraceae bacterium]|jgi:hypothetical protein